MFTAYEKDLPLVHKRKVVRVRVESLPGEPIHARVGFISPNLDEATRSAHVRVVLENPGRRLKNKSFAEGTIKLDAPEVLAIPRSAVLRPGGTPRVFVRREPDAYELREVKLDSSGDALREVLNGVKEDEQVATSAGVLLDCQSRMNRDANP